MIVSIITATVLVSLIFCFENPQMAYNRPDSSASVFGILEVGEPVNITVRTASGWLGFDPGTAQAANTGSFRYRWLPPGTISAGTDSLETLWAPKPGITYAMTYSETPVFTEPDTASVLLSTIGCCSAAEVMETSGNWVKVNLNGSPEPQDIQGWISFDGVSLNTE